MKSGTPASSRARPFSLTFFPNGPDQDPGEYKTRVLPMNAAPVEIENAHFVGKAILMHDTGNEPGADPHVIPDLRRGVELQIQGKFKKTVEKGGETESGLWVGGELPKVLNLGWIMQNVVQLCMRYARKKTEGRVNFTLGGKGDNPQLTFPIGQLFTCISSPPGATPPVMGSQELKDIKWPGAGWIDIVAGNTYTLLYKTPFLDLCSWDLLRIPGVSPLPLESILGDVNSAQITMFDLGVVNGVHKNWRQGTLLHWVFQRGAEGDLWTREPEEEEDVTPALRGTKPLEADDGEDDASDEAVSEISDEDDAVVAVDDQHANDESSQSSDESLDSEDDEQMSKADSQALFEIDAWRPRSMTMVEGQTLARVPYYIEAIDRRRRRKVRIWYVIAMTSSEGELWWHAKAATELATLCRPRRRLTTFRRGPGARRYTCCAVNTLEQFRHVVTRELTNATKLRDVVIAQAVVEADLDRPSEHSPVAAAQVSEEELSPKVMTPAGLARKVRKGRARGPLLPPRFFKGSGTTCGLAFAHAREGRKEVAREALVGSVHFEGRLCEELIRLSTDGTIRCFTPYDCEKPRVRIRPTDLLHVEAVEGLFLGRFHLWQVQTLLRVFVFCTADAQDRTDWIQAIVGVIEVSKLPQTAGPVIHERSQNSSGSKEKELQAREANASQASSQATAYNGQGTTELFSQSDCLPAGTVIQAKGDIDPLPAPDVTDDASPTPKKRIPIDKLNGLAFMGKVNSTLHSTLNMVSLKYSLRGGNPTDLTALLTDSTRARRWRPIRRLVLNDRLLLAESTPAPLPSVAEGMLEALLRLHSQPQPAAGDMVAFATSVCRLKAVRFAGWSNCELLAFWLNVYHTLLLHGLLLLGTPNGRKEMKRFHIRVSYLVGMRPVSLREIEQVILRIPQVDPQKTVRVHAGARARQLVSLCGCCRRKRGSGRSPEGSPPGDGDKHSSRSGSPASTSSQHSWGKHAASKAVTKNRQCLPLPPMPKPPWKNYSGHPPCLYLGKEPESLAVPKLELRSILVLNRGRLNSLPDIPVFHSNRVNSELEDVCRKFVAEFVDVQFRDGRAIRVTLPENCKAFSQALNSPNSTTIIRWLWQFQPPDSTLPTQNTKVKFQKSNEDPRERREFRKLQYSDPNLRHMDSQDRSQQVGTEFDVLNGTAQALAKLVVSPTAQNVGDCVIDVQPAPCEVGQRPTSPGFGPRGGSGQMSPPALRDHAEAVVAGDEKTVMVIGRAGNSVEVSL